MVAVCKDDQGALVQYPLLPHKGYQHLCYSPCAGLVVETSIPTKMVPTISKRPASHIKTLVAEVAKGDGDVESDDTDGKVGEPDEEDIGEQDAEKLGEPDHENIGEQDEEKLGEPDQENVGEPEKIGELETEKLGEPDQENVGEPEKIGELETEKVGELQTQKVEIEAKQPTRRVVGKRPLVKKEAPMLSEGKLFPSNSPETIIRGLARYN